MSITQHAPDFALTTYCQAKCRSCVRTNQVTGEKEDWLELKHMDLDVFRKTLATSLAVDFSYIKFCGEFGDPMMHPQIDKFIETALEFTPVVEISTNGGLRNHSWYVDIAKRYGNKLYIRWAIDGATHDVNWKYREGVDFNKAWNKMVAHSKTPGSTSWDFLVFEWNWHQIPEVARLAKELDIFVDFKINTQPHGLLKSRRLPKVKEMICQSTT